MLQGWSLKNKWGSERNSSTALKILPTDFSLKSIDGVVSVLLMLCMEIIPGH